MYGLWSWGLLSLGLCIVFLVRDPVEAVVGGAPASAPEPDAAVVFAQRHGRSVRIEGMRDARLGYYSFFGIRFNAFISNILNYNIKSSLLILSCLLFFLQRTFRYKIRLT
jgi:hypothetical protein